VTGSRFSSSARRRSGRGRAGSEDTPPPTTSVRAAAYACLSRREYTTTELRQRLVARGYPETDVDEAIRHLSASGALDDRRVAAAHVRTATGIKGRGRRRIEQELLARGISRDAAQTALAELSADAEPAAIARILVRRRVPARLDAAVRRRLVQHLLRRGFSMDAINRALRAHGSGGEHS
jgi:regulatory protein